MTSPGASPSWGALRAAAPTLLTGSAAGYLEAGLLLGFASLMLALLVRRGGASVLGAPAGFARLSWALAGLALAAPVLWRSFGTGSPGSAAIEVWGARGKGWQEVGGAGAEELADRLGAAAGLTAAADGRLAVWIGRPLFLMLVAAITLGVFGVLLRGLGRRRRLGRWCLALPIWKRRGRVRLCVSDGLAVPFAARVRGLAFIVVPTALLIDPARARLVVAHEAAHHRRGDLMTATLLAGLRALFFWNPLLGLWQRALVELEDLACDRRVLGRVGVRAGVYGEALLWAATGAGQQRIALWGGRAMASRDLEVMKRRIIMLKSEPNEGGSRGARRAGGVALATVTLASLLLGSWAVRGAVAEGKVTAAEVTAAAARIEARAGFPMPVDDRVVAAVNHKVGTPEGRLRTKVALERLRAYRPLLEEALARQGLPQELIGVVMAESAFDNDARPNRPAAVQSAGIWQLIPGTARRLGLEVSLTRDERLDPARATAAAMAFLGSLKQRYGDWPVAIAAYNGGIKAIDSLAKDVAPAEARRRLLESDTEFGHYLASVIASVIIIENPALVD